MTVAEKHHTGRRPPIPVPLLLLVLTVLFFWRLLFTPDFTWLNRPEVANQLLPALQLQTGADAKLTWNPYNWSGQPWFGDASNGATDPLLRLASLTPRRNGWLKQRWLHIWFLFIHYLAALSCYTFARRRGLQFLPAITAACLYSFAGPVAGAPTLLTASVWIPLALLFLFELPSPRSAALAGLFCALTWLSLASDLPIYLLLIAIGFWTWHAVRLRRAIVLPAAIFLVTTFLTGAIRTLPALEYDLHALRWVDDKAPIPAASQLPYTVHEYFQLNPRQLFDFIHPTPFYIGLIAVAFAIAGWIAWRKQPLLIPLHITALAAIAIALGDRTGLWGPIYALLPIGTLASNNATALFFVHLAIAVTAAHGLDHLSRRFTQIASALGAAIILISLAYVTIVGQMVDNRSVLAALLLFLASAVAYARTANRITCIQSHIALFAILLVDIAPAAANWSHTREQSKPLLGQLAANSDIVAYLRNEPGVVRTYHAPDLFPFPFGQWFKLETLEGPSTTVLSSFYQLDPGSPRVKDLLGVTHTIAKQPEHPSQIRLITGQDGLSVYRNPNAHPRAWFVHQTRPAANAAELRRLVETPEVDLRYQAITPPSPPKLEDCGANDTVSVRERRPGFTRLLVSANCRGLTVLSDLNYPGWTAKIDGRPATILPVYGALLSVVTEKGAHTIDFEFQSTTLRLGAILSTLGLLLTAAIVLRYRSVPTDIPIP